MIMVIGGSFQGKEQFVKDTLKKDIAFLDGSDCTYEEIFTCEGIRNFHLFVKRFLLEEERLDTLAEEVSEKNPEIVIVSDEIGYGIVPIDKTERLWREKTGRICCKLMQKTKEAYRVMAGCGMKIKG